MTQPRIVGLAGPYCAGKNSLLPFFVERGYEVLDLDKIGHEVLELEKTRLVQVFGQDILDGDKINRRKLGAKVFQSRRRLRKLEAIVHPRMRTQAIHLLSENPAVNFVLNAAILFRLGLDKFCDLIVWIDSGWWIRLIRGLRRDGLGLRQTLLRVFAQKQNLKVIQEDSDIIRVKNQGDLERTLQELREKWEKMYGAP